MGEIGGFCDAGGVAIFVALGGAVAEGLCWVGGIEQGLLIETLEGIKLLVEGETIGVGDLAGGLPVIVGVADVAGGEADFCGAACSIIAEGVGGCIGIGTLGCSACGGVGVLVGFVEAAIIEGLAAELVAGGVVVAGAVGEACWEGGRGGGVCVGVALEVVVEIVAVDDGADGGGV